MQTLRVNRILILVSALCSAVACAPLKPVPPAAGLPRLADLDPNNAPAASEFNRTLSPVVALRRTESNLLVRPLINGHDLGWFILDTGASGMTITPQASRRANLPAIASTTIQGTLPTTVYQADTLQIGQLTLQQPRFAGLAMPWSRLYFGEHVAGICGWDVFANSIVEIDMRDQRVAVHDPDSFTLDENLWQPIELVIGRPHVRAKFTTVEGKSGEGEFLLDTGYSGAVWFFPKAADQSDLHAEAFGRKRKMVMVDASATVRDVKLDCFEMAGRTFQRVDAALTIGRGKTRQERMPIMGIVGLSLLRDSRVIIDYNNQRIAMLARE